jgi:hypothetical protein
MKWTAGLRLALATMTLAACDASQPEPEPFQYDLTRSSAIDIEAHDVSGPLRGVVVSVRAPSDEPGLTGALLWMGATGQDGHARALVRTETAGDSLDITLHKAGRRGPWTDESLRVAQGITAPSSRLIVPIAQAQSMNVDLERSP